MQKLHPFLPSVEWIEPAEPVFVNDGLRLMGHVARDGNRWQAKLANGISLGTFRTQDDARVVVEAIGRAVILAAPVFPPPATDAPPPWNDIPQADRLLWLCRLSLSGLPDWEQTFVAQIAARLRHTPWRRLSPKQIGVIDRALAMLARGARP